MIHNPVLRGFNPDPSVVRVGEVYYLATSTMVWQPGIRLFQSPDLANWSLIGHALTEAEHDLRGLATHQGIWAPCLTYSEPERLFYLTYSLVLSTATDYFDVDNFLVTAGDVRGPWSEPVYLNSLGFDPSLFHDEDGRHWLVTLEWDPREGYEHRARSCSRSTTPTVTPCVVRARASSAAPRIAAAWKGPTCTGATATTTT